MEEEKFGYDTYLSPFTWRYGSREMKRIFSEIGYRALWRRIWVSIAEAQSKYGLVSENEVADLRSKMGPEHVDLKRAHEIEEKIKHDVMAEIKAYAEQCPTGGGKIHLGATSADVEDNADILRMRDALNLVLKRLALCLHSLSEFILKHKGVACMGWTHLQPAEPTTLGYRFSNYAQDLVLDVWNLEGLLQNFVKLKGLKGAVGTSASFKKLLGGKASPSQLEKIFVEKIGAQAFDVSTQTYPRKLDYLVLSALAGVAQSAHKFAFDTRLMQSPAFGELSEAVGGEQVGSTAMPFKRNPVASERICSLARYVGSLPSVAFGNAANTLLERTLDDSANRRLIIPEAFLAVEECLILYDRVVEGLRVYEEMVRRNLYRFSAFAATEAILMKLVERGADRQEAHEIIRRHSSRAWERVLAGGENPLIDMLKRDRFIRSKLKPREIDSLAEPSTHVGDAPERCEKYVQRTVKPIITKYKVGGVGGSSTRF